MLAPSSRLYHQQSRRAQSVNEGAAHRPVRNWPSHLGNLSQNARYFLV
jgi:hypothetical protein